MEDAIASIASGMQSENVGMQISTAILKQTQDQEKRFAQAIIGMISNTTPSSDSAIGRMLDVSG